MTPVQETLYYVIAPSYHGATFLALLLNSHPDITYPGDTIPKRRFLDSRCSCGERISDCPFWSYILDATASGRNQQDERFVGAYYPDISSSPVLNRAANLAVGTLGLAIGPAAWIPFRNAANKYAHEYLAVSRAAKKWNGSRLFIDGGKSLVRVWVNRSLFPSHDTRLIHLIRDPRAFHASNLKNLATGASIEASCKSWKRKHRFTSWLGRGLLKPGYLQVRYEDLCLNPNETLGQVLDFLDVDSVNLLEHAKVAENQHVIGNVSKNNFDGSIRFRESWREVLSHEEANEIVRLTEPYSSRFGYLFSGVRELTA